eukprot:NODE_3315_length_1000_cov_21.355415_g3048_i0.p1 GENE.NODE_3315_length_1000_cov_21.355415_g3048_i0~~NODE_3315_length_1000_cov_21.355415_g3048_i0.p1  ORF type:complete len:298 (+),score=81.73 NODE_3315_length_1000_cov_21.355415_g3048_i0:58-894(+)
MPKKTKQLQGDSSEDTKPKKKVGKNSSSIEDETKTKKTTSTGISEKTGKVRKAKAEPSEGQPLIKKQKIPYGASAAEAAAAETDGNSNNSPKGQEAARSADDTKMFLRYDRPKLVMRLLQEAFPSVTSAEYLLNMPVAHITCEPDTLTDGQSGTVCGREVRIESNKKQKTASKYPFVAKGILGIEVDFIKDYVEGYRGLRYRSLCAHGCTVFVDPEVAKKAPMKSTYKDVDLTVEAVDESNREFVQRKDRKKKKKNIAPANESFEGEEEGDGDYYGSD